MFRLAFILNFGVVGIVLGALPASAQTTHEPPPEAVELSNQAAEHYANGQYGDAAADLENALQLDPGSPTLLYNLARVYELMGDVEKALANAEAYLLVVPPENEEERAIAESTVQRLTGARDYLRLRQQAQQQGATPELRQLAPRVIVRERGIADTPFWATLASGAGLLVVGAVLGGVALKLESDVNSRTIDSMTNLAAFTNELESDADRADRFALTADVLLGLGAAATVSALLLYVLRTRSYERDAEPTELTFDSTGRDFSLRLRRSF